MRNGRTIAAVIPALNEEQSIGRVLADIPGWVDDIVVVDNGSTDQTARVATRCGARVIREVRRGYGAACLAGLAALHEPAVVVFLDADYSDYPHEAARLVDPILNGTADLVIGSRTLGWRQARAMTWPAMLGNRLACGLMRVLWRARYSDLGPFRAIRWKALQSLHMQDRGYGWTIEMQIKAVRAGLRVREIPVSYRPRIGQSKISGTLRGILAAGAKILFTVAKHALSPPSRRTY